MLLKFTSSDMLNTSLIDVSTGCRAYDIVTAMCHSADDDQLSVVSSEDSFADSTSKASPLPSSPSKKHISPSDSQTDSTKETRRTTITDTAGVILANIIWHGRRPQITLFDEKVGPLTDLFGSVTVPFMPKVLAIPARFDTEYIWTATPDSLTLFDYDSEAIKGSFHQNVIRISSSPKTPKLKLSSPSKFKLSSTSSTNLNSCSSNSSLSSLYKEKSVSELKAQKATFIPTRVPGVGSNYLEFLSHPLAHDIEIVVSFIMMEILRRGRFSLTPYTFEKPKLWQFKEAKDLFMRRLRRNTV